MAGGSQPYSMQRDALPMVEDPDIRRAAKFMIERHGANAAPAAAARASELLSSGDIGAAEIWRQIAEAIIELSNSQN